MNTVFTVLEITNEKNGYNMPIIKVKSSTPLVVVNRGWNHFECQQEIDISDLQQLDVKFAGESTLHLEIHTPDRETCCWYYPVINKDAKYKLNW